MIAATVEFNPADVKALQERMLAMRDYTGRSARAVVFATTKDFLFEALAATPVAERSINRLGPAFRNGKPGVWALIRRARGRAKSIFESPFVNVRGRARKIRRKARVIAQGGNIDPVPRRTLVTWENAKKWGLRKQVKPGRPYDPKNEFGVTFAQWKGVGQERNYGRGFAKAGWIGALRTLGVGTGQKVTPMAVGFSDVVNMLAGEQPAMSVANQVPYIEELDRGTPRRPPANIMEQALRSTIAKMDERLVRLAAGFESKWLGGEATVPA